jgi:hypothetical protein
MNTIERGTGMTLKDAAKKFCLDEKEVRKRKEDGMVLGVRKEKGHIHIPDDTQVIPPKTAVQAFLLQILKNKNEQPSLAAETLCPNDEKRKVLLEYLCKRGLINRNTAWVGEEYCLAAFNLTEAGLNYVVGDFRYKQLDYYSRQTIVW